MRARFISFALAAVAVVGLSACGEKPQGMGGVRSDKAPYTGVGDSQYARPGWTAGDKASWEQQIKTRAQSQNEYNRTPPR